MPHNELYQDFSTDITSLFEHFPKLDVDPLDCDFCILKNTYMVHWGASLRGPRQPINITATRIVVDQFLLDTMMPSFVASDDKHLEVQRAISCCPHGAVVFVKVDDNQSMVDYTAAAIHDDWHRFFVDAHPSTLMNGCAPPYSHLSDSQLRSQIATKLLGERPHGTVSQRQRVETTVLGSYLFTQQPERWKGSNIIQKAIKVHEHYSQLKFSSCVVY